jgi:DNA-binding NarL/FixJ family response regulator
LNAGARYTVLLADDHAPTREDIGLILSEDGRFAVCAEAADAAAAVAAAVRERPDICLLDLRMPGGGLAAAWEITARLPHTSVVMFTVSHDDCDVFNSLRAGAAGYLVKDMEAAELPPALARVMAGEAVLAPTLLTMVVHAFRDRSARRRRALADGAEAHLTSREWDILESLREGLTTGQIARRLNVSPVTARTHTSAIVRKLRVRDRRDLVRPPER